MLKHKDIRETSSRPAAQVRVTPEELAQALSRIEARKDTDQRQADGTIPIGEAVQQLGLDATPEKVLAEVQAARAQQATRKGSSSSRRRLALLLGVGMGLVGLVGCWGSPHSPRTHMPPAVPRLVPKNESRPTLLDPNMIVADAFGKPATLSEVGDNRRVRCYYGEGSFQPYSLPGGGPYWTLIKHGGRVYVRGWVSRLPEKAMGSGGRDIGLWKYSGFTVPVTLPLDNMQVTARDGDPTQIHTTAFHLDKYAYEKWNP